MSLRGLALSMWSAIVCVAASTAAWAQDYTVTTATNRLETRPSGASLVNITDGGQNPSLYTVVNLPFAFQYYGRAYTQMTVACYGFVVPGTTGVIFNPGSNTNSQHGPSSTTGAFAYGVSSASDIDGLIASYWDRYVAVNSGAGSGTVYSWVSGAAPNRHVVFAWENVSADPNTGFVPFTHQIQLYEGSGRIVFAYSNPSGAYTRTNYVCGLDSYGDGRYTVPSTLTNSYSNHGYPGSDFVLDPAIVTYTGTLVYDKLVSDASGLGNSIQSNVPLRDCRIELRRNSDGLVWAGATTAANGTFSITGIGLPGGTPGSFVAMAQTAACSVSATSGAAPTSWTVNSSLSFASGANLGTQSLGANGDANADVRAALNVACDCEAAYEWAVARTSDAIPQLEVLLDPASTSTTSYRRPQAPNAASMRVASRAAANPDAWDDAIVTRTYGRHMLNSIAGSSATTYDDRFDAVTDETNAFAEGFGYYLWAAVSDSSQAIDATGASAAIVRDLESPTITVAKGPDVAGCVAGALYDLIDPANEVGDAVDGSLTSDRLFRAVDALTAAPTPKAVVQAWSDAGYDPVALTRVFVANHALVDDVLEPNDDRTDAPSLGGVGFLPKTFVLNRFNEDWFSVTLPSDAQGLAADAKYDAFTSGATVGVEIRTTSGMLLATGVPVVATGAVHAQTAPISAGTYRVGVRHLGGGAVSSYVFQAFVPPSMDAKPIHDWTVGRSYDIALGVVDGVPPYTLGTPGSAMPPGLGLISNTTHATGVPSTIGSYQVTVELRDSGNPVNVVTRNETVVIHDVFKLPLPAFVGFTADRPVDVTLPTHEGTPPFTLSMTAGALPAGLAFAPNSLHVAGTAAPGSSALELDGVDVAGSADHVATRAVAAVQFVAKGTPADLAAGEAACGWWFDAVAGSTANFAVKTVKGQAKRALSGILLAPDRSVVATGKIKSGLGFVTATKLVCPQSGRYYFVASSTDALAATQLAGTLVVSPPKSGKAKFAAFAPNDTTTIEVGALPGATLVLKFAGDKKKALTAKLVSVVDPDGVSVPSLASFVKPSPIGGVLTLSLPTGGTWTIVLAAESGSGEPGKLTWSYAVKQPKGATYSAD